MRISFKAPIEGLEELARVIEGALEHGYAELVGEEGLSEGHDELRLIFIRADNPPEVSGPTGFALRVEPSRADVEAAQADGDNPWLVWADGEDA